MRHFQRTALAVAVLCGIAGATSCSSAPPDDAWVIAPVEYDNSPDDAVGSDIIDVTYPMAHITGDTEGGFWTESAGSWLHIDRDGAAIRRFNLTGEMAYLRVRGISALDSSTLVVSGHFDGEWEGGLWEYDTATSAWTPWETDALVVGDVASVDGAVFYVEHLYDAAGDSSFVVWLRGGIGDRVISPEREVPEGDQVKLSVAGDGSVVVNTGSEVLVLDASEWINWSASPSGASVLSSNDTGMAAWTSPATDAAPSWFVDGGSAEARRLTEVDESCEPRSIETSAGGISPPLCNIQAVEWIDASTLIVSAGTEGGSVLAAVTLPRK